MDPTSSTLPSDENNLRDPQTAAASILRALEASPEGVSAQALLKALKRIALAHGMSQLASGSESVRRGLYKALNANGNPRLRTLVEILGRMGLELSVKPRRPLSGR